MGVPRTIQVKETETWYLNLDCELLRRSPSTVTLYQHLLLYPQEIIPIMDMVINDVFEEKFPEVAVAPQGIQVRPYNLEKTTNMRDLNPSGTFPTMARTRTLVFADADES